MVDSWNRIRRFRKAGLAAALMLLGASFAVSPVRAQDFSEIPGAAELDLIIGGINAGIDVLVTPKEKKSYTDPACKVEKPVCGAIVYGNGGGYTVSSVLVEAKSKQPANPYINPGCAGVRKRLTADLKINIYDTFIVPADCLYKLKIEIAGGRTKSRDIFLTPGCLAQTYTDGTTTKNEWHKKIKWIDGTKPTNGPATPADPLGNKCTVS